METLSEIKPPLWQKVEITHSEKHWPVNGIIQSVSPDNWDAKIHCKALMPMTISGLITRPSLIAFWSSLSGWEPSEAVNHKKKSSKIVKLQYYLDWLLKPSLPK